MCWVDKTFALLYLDLWSYPKPTSTDDSYFLSNVDDHTQLVWLYVLHIKSQTTNVFLVFKKMVGKNLIALLRLCKQMVKKRFFVLFKVGMYVSFWLYAFKYAIIYLKNYI